MARMRSIQFLTAVITAAVIDGRFGSVSHILPMKRFLNNRSRVVVYIAAESWALPVQTN